MLSICIPNFPTKRFHLNSNFPSPEPYFVSKLPIKGNCLYRLHIYLLSHRIQNSSMIWQSRFFMPNLVKLITKLRHNFLYPNIYLRNFWCTYFKPFENLNDFHRIGRQMDTNSALIFTPGKIICLIWYTLIHLMYITIKHNIAKLI